MKPWQPRRMWEELWISKAMALQGDGQVNLPKSQGQRGPEEGLRISREMVNIGNMVDQGASAPLVENLS